MAVSVIDPAAVWGATLETLSRQMTRSSYDTILKGVTVASVTPPAWVIAARNEENREWLANRLQDKIRLALAPQIGYEPELSFVVAPVQKSQIGILSPEIAIPAPAAINGEVGQPGFVQGIDFAALWFGRSEDGGTGYDRLAKYWSRFWRAYLNRFNSRAYELWEYLLTPDKSDQARPPYWTRPRPYQIKPTAKILGCSPVMITGGFRQCSVFDTALAEGVVLPECCGVHCPSEMRKNQFGQPQCRFWRTGALEVLYREGLLAIRISGDSSKDTYHHLQVWRLLPLLSPWQAEALPESEWPAHRDWIEAQGKSFNAEAWHNYSGRRMVFEMADRDTGRTYHDAYRPNPLLSDSVESDNDQEVRLSDSVESDNDDE